MSPLFKPKSKKSESESPKSEKPSLSIALNVQKHAKKKKMADGGEVPERAPSADDAESKSMAKEIMERRRMKNMNFKDEEGMTIDKIGKENYADGGMVDLDEESEEQPNEYYKLNRMAADHEQYDDSQIESQPMDSNEHGHSIQDEIDKGIVAAIRRKMAAKRGE